MFDIFKNRLEITGVLTTITALRVSQGRSLEPIGADLPVVKDALGRPLIPGSSFKGAMRSRLESFLRGVLFDDSGSPENSIPMRKLVADPAVEDEWALTRDEIKTLKGMTFEEIIKFCWVRNPKLSPENSIPESDPLRQLSFDRLTKVIKLKSEIEANRQLREPPTSEDLEHVNRLPDSVLIERLKGRYESQDDALSQAILIETDLASKLFGSPWISSKFQVRDLTVSPENWFDQYQERDGVAIDRDTETAADGKLYSFQVVPAGTPFEFRAIVENAEDWELGLLMIGLHQFETEQIPLGGGRSRGLGVVKLLINDAWWFDYPDGDPAQLINYMQRLIANDREPDHLNPEQFANQKSQWAEALIRELRRPKAQRFQPQTEVAPSA